MSLVIELVNHHHHSHFSSRRTDSAMGCVLLLLQASVGSQLSYCNNNVGYSNRSKHIDIIVRYRACS